ncbi:MAG: glycoside hydrolase family 30 beta sandwich domain-containing protein [Ferruginibacter sp.]
MQKITSIKLFKTLGIVTILCASVLSEMACSKKINSQTIVPPPILPVNNNDVSYYITKGDQSVLFQKQTDLFAFGAATASSETIEVDSSQSFQTIDGFGYTLTGGSAALITGMNPAERANLLNELFTSDGAGIGVSYLRVSIGASDLNSTVFSYDDLPVGQTDLPLSNFSLSQDTLNVIPVLKQILAINPAIKILASPWSPPVWMKDNKNSIGGSLLPQYYNVYAAYFVKYIQQMKARGINIDAVTIQNEPQYGGNNPSMVMSALQQAEFIKTNLGPAFSAAAIKTKIIIWDHNCDNPGFPLAVLNDAAAKQYIDGSAFHLYNGDISALSSVHNTYPEKNVYFTEQWTGSKESFDGNLYWHIKNVIIGSMKNWSKVALEWNLANDPSFGPHTPGGCTECKGAVTINGSSFVRNVGYYIVAQAAKFVGPGSVRITSSSTGSLANVAFITPGGKKVVIVLNDKASAQTLNIHFKTRTIVTVMPAGSVATYSW